MGIITPPNTPNTPQPHTDKCAFHSIPSSIHPSIHTYMHTSLPLFTVHCSLGYWYLLVPLGTFDSFGTFGTFGDTFGSPSIASHFYLSLVEMLATALHLPALLIPFVTFSLFHVSTYLSRTLIKLFPTSLHSLSPPLKSFVDTYQPRALDIIAYYEAAFLPLAILVGVFGGWIRWVSILGYLQFIRLRYARSNTTKRAFRALRITADRYLDQPNVPESIRKAYLVARDGIERLGGGAVGERRAEAPTEAATNSASGTGTGTATGTATGTGTRGTGEAAEASTETSTKSD